MQLHDPGPITQGGSPRHSLTGSEFRRRFRWLVFHSWNIPPVFGLGFILLIGILTPAQLLGILITPLEPAYIFGWLALAIWFLPRAMRPLSDWLDGSPGSSPEGAVRAVQRFPLLYWTTFIVYLVLAPVSVIAAAHIYTDFVATPLALFRIELVALIVSIIVGLPIFFLIFDLFGRALGGLELKHPIVTVRTKVFLIGALVPLLIDTMLVQYYWTRTGFFNAETFGVWVLLEVLAIGGSLIFAHSFGQSLSPLQKLIGAPRPLPEASITLLRPRSTDELGLLTKDYRLLLDELRLSNEVLGLNNKLLRIVGSEPDTATVLNAIVEICKHALKADRAFLIVYDAKTGSLAGVAQTGADYKPEGHYHLPLDDQSLAVWAFKQQQTAVSEDASRDTRVNTRLRTRFDIHSALATPIRLGEDALGVLMAANTSARAYGERERALIEGLAREAALALQTQNLRDTREQSKKTLVRHNLLLRTMASSAEMLVRDHSEQQLMHDICRLLVEEGRFRMAWIGMVAPDGMKVRPAAEYGFEEGYLAQADIRCDESPQGQGPTGTAIRLGKTVINDDTETNPRFSPWRERARILGYRSSLATPLRMAGRVIGALNVYGAEAHVFDTDEVVLIEKLATDLGLTLERRAAEAARHNSEERLKRQQNALIVLADHQAKAANDVASVLQAVTETVAATLEVQRASVWHHTSGGTAIVCLDLYEAGKGMHSSGVKIDESSYPRYFEALRENRIIAAADAYTAPETREFGASYLRPLGIGAMLDAPIQRAGTAIGVLCCEHVGGAREWSTDEQNFANAVADFVSLCLELHEHQLTSENLRRHREQLEELVAERTAQLESTNRELEAFSYSVSHDLRAPLRAVDGFARALTEDYGHVFDEQAQDYLRRVRSGTQRMGMLIDDLLQLSRIGRAAFNPVRVDLSAMAHGIQEQLAAAAPERKVIFENAPGLVCQGDERLLNIALTNLLDNAWKYTGKTDDARIEFGASRQDGQMVYHVRDNGAGFDMQYSGKLFGAFQRLHGAEFPGTGIGLATVARIIHRHGGRIWAEATIDQGATFSFTLGPEPALEADAAAG
jgi:GAF domain-containing protein